jgi:hypothetical protein
LCIECPTCPTGNYWSAPCEKISAGTCSPCPPCSAGTFRSGCSGSSTGSCVACPGGHYCLDSSNPPTPCTTTSSGCLSGQYRSQCTDGSKMDGQCVACDNGPINSVYTGVSTTGISSNCPYNCVGSFVKTSGFCCVNCGNGYFNPSCTKTSSGACTTCNN